MNLYELLGISKDATKAEIKKAYRKMASKLHPDKPGGDKQKFQDIQTAYAILTDDMKREHYDRTGEADQRKSPLEDKLMQIFDAFIEADNFTGDIIERVNDALKGNIGEAERRVERAKKKVAKLSALLGRVTTKEGQTNYFEMVLKGKIDAQGKAVEFNQSIADDMGKMLEMLEGYKDGSPVQESAYQTLSGAGILGRGFDNFA